MADHEAHRMAPERGPPASGERPRPAATLPMLERRTRMRRAVWYSILAALIVVALMMPFFLET